MFLKRRLVAVVVVAASQHRLCELKQWLFNVDLWCRKSVRVIVQMIIIVSQKSFATTLHDDVNRDTERASQSMMLRGKKNVCTSMGNTRNSLALFMRSPTIPNTNSRFLLFVNQMHVAKKTPSSGLQDGHQQRMESVSSLSWGHWWTDVLVCGSSCLFLSPVSCGRMATQVQFFWRNVLWLRKLLRKPRRKLQPLSQLPRRLLRRLLRRSSLLTSSEILRRLVVQTTSRLHCADEKSCSSF